MASWLATGAGGAAGLESVMEQMIKEKLQRDTLSETTRHNTASEENASQNMRLLNNYREDTLGQRRDAAGLAAKDRELGLAEKRVAMRPIGSTVPDDEAGNDMKVGAASRANFDWQPANMGKSTEQGEVGPTPGGFTWRGTQDQITKAAQAAKESGHVSDANFMLDGKPIVGLRNPQGRINYHDEDVTDRVTPYTPPEKPDRVVVNTGDGFQRRSDVNNRLANGENVEGPLPAMTRQRMYSSRQVLSHFQDTRDEIDEADRRGLLGPLEGRWSEFLRGKVGSTDLGPGLGSPENDELLNQLRTDLKLTGSGTMMAHFGARGGQNLIEEFNRNVLNSGQMSRAGLRGSLSSIEKWLNTYGSNPAAGGGAPKQTAPPADDPYTAYLNRKKQ